MLPDEWFEWPEWAKDAIVVDVEIHFSWADRLRVLLRGRADVRAKVFTEHLPGQVKTLTTAYALKLWTRKRFGYVTVAPPAGTEPRP